MRKDILNCIFAAAIALFLALPAAQLSAEAVFGLLLAADAPAPEVPIPSVPDKVAASRDECLEIPSVGCYFSAAPEGVPVPLLIYYRGWVLESNFPGGGLHGGHITGRSNILRSSRAALSFYKLKKLAFENGIAVLVTGSSDIRVTRSDLDRLQSDLGVVFGQVSIAAHSGGYVGLSGSIDSFGKLERIILLDPFYYDFSAQVGAKIKQGAACSGFYTPHNAERFKQFFSGIGCRAESRASPADHEAYVPASLTGAFSVPGK